MLCQLLADNVTCLRGTTVKVCIRPVARPMNTVYGTASNAVSIAMYDAQLYIYSGYMYICIYCACLSVKLTFVKTTKSTLNYTMRSATFHKTSCLIVVK